jgi:hypothetical protein
MKGRQVLKCCKQNLNARLLWCSCYGNSEAQNTNKNVNNREGHGDSDRKDSVGNWIRSHSCHILKKNLSTFCPCPETSSEAEFKSNERINLAEEIST